MTHLQILLASDIANAFAHHFKDVYNPKDNDSFNPVFYQSIETLYKSLKTETMLNNFFPGGDISMDEISTLIREKLQEKISSKTNTSFMVAQN